MTGLEIFLLIAGFVCLCISAFVARRTVPEQEQKDGGVHTAAIWTEKEEQLIRERVDEILSDRQSELVEATEEQMNRLCNDKIMAVDEFSRQILEKIENNHQEVVFMYNMLNEKEKEVKNVILEPVKKKEEKSALPEPSFPKHASPESAPPKPAISEPVFPEPNSPEQVETAISRLTSRQVSKEKQRAVKKEAAKTPTESMVKASAKKVETPAASDDVKAQIRKMHKEGKSVLEISKALNLGQGEVKLVIALYGGKKG